MLINSHSRRNSRRPVSNRISASHGIDSKAGHPAAYIDAPVVIPRHDRIIRRNRTIARIHSGQATSKPSIHIHQAGMRETSSGQINEYRTGWIVALCMIHSRKATFAAVASAANGES